MSAPEPVSDDLMERLKASLRIQPAKREPDLRAEAGTDWDRRSAEPDVSAMSERRLPTVAFLEQRLADLMDPIERLFKPGRYFTLIVRNPENPEEDVLLTQDSYSELRALLDRREAADKP